MRLSNMGGIWLRGIIGWMGLGLMGMMLGREYKDTAILLLALGLLWFFHCMNEMDKMKGR